jgi:hypothetical protein
MKFVPGLLGAAAVALVATGCATSSEQQANQSPNPTTSQIASAQQQTQDTLKQAQEAQKAASDQARKAADADARVRHDQERLSQDQATARQEEAKAQQLQAQAQQQMAQSSQVAQQQQQAASNGLAEETRRSGRGQQLAAGVVTEIRSDEIVVQPSSGAPMSFRVNQNTEVRISGQESRLDEILAGTKARVAYQTSGNGLMAVRVTVSPMGGQDQNGTGSGASPSAPPSAPTQGTQGGYGQ